MRAFILATAFLCLVAQAPAAQPIYVEVSQLRVDLAKLRQLGIQPDELTSLTSFDVLLRLGCATRETSQRITTASGSEARFTLRNDSGSVLPVLAGRKIEVELSLGSFATSVVCKPGGGQCAYESRSGEIARLIVVSADVKPPATRDTSR
jgi:hypothetical protein